MSDALHRHHRCAATARRVSRACRQRRRGPDLQRSRCAESARSDYHAAAAGDRSGAAVCRDVARRRAHQPHQGGPGARVHRDSRHVARWHVPRLPAPRVDLAGTSRAIRLRTHSRASRWCRGDRGRPDAPGSLDYRGTRRAPRYRMVEGTEAQVDGASAMVIDLSTVGAQIVSPDAAEAAAARADHAGR